MLLLGVDFILDALFIPGEEIISDEFCKYKMLYIVYAYVRACVGASERPWLRVSDTYMCIIVLDRLFIEVSYSHVPS